MQNKVDANFTGVGNIIAGEYRNVKIEGLGSIGGDVKAESIIAEGVIKGKGNIYSNDMDIQGVFSCRGNVEVNNKVNAEGLAKIYGDLQCGEFCGNGAFEIDGLLSADRISLILEKKSKIGEIGGSNIKVVLGRSGGFFSFIKKTALFCNSIEGDEIYLENTVCKSVRGKNIRIENGCDIEELHVSGELFVSPNARVKNIVRI